jgi:Cd2+/Zn2+-exporting ATPase
VRELADRIGITEYRGDLLPEQKLQQVKRLLSSSRRHGVAFVGDGINDAPALALSDIGIAMGNAGNDVAVETADVVVRSGSPAKVAEAVRIARRTRHIVRFNITLSIAVKAAVLLLGGAGLAPLWLAVLADTGVALLCVLNVFTLWR